MKLLKRVALALAGSIALVALFTWWALEWDGVAVIETRAADGATRETHVWYVEHEDEIWVEAGAPSNPWFLEAARDPGVSFTTASHSGRYRVEPIENPAGHERIRSLLRAKYGIRDAWIAFLFDTSASIAARLVPADSESGNARVSE